VGASAGARGRYVGASAGGRARGTALPGRNATGWAQGPVGLARVAVRGRGAEHMAGDGLDYCAAAKACQALPGVLVFLAVVRHAFGRSLHFLDQGLQKTTRM
jgi:hypothetical protein